MKNYLTQTSVKRETKPMNRGRKKFIGNREDGARREGGPGKVEKSELATGGETAVGPVTVKQKVKQPKNKMCTTTLLVSGEGLTFKEKKRMSVYPSKKKNIPRK